MYRALDAIIHFLCACGCDASKPSWLWVRSLAGMMSGVKCVCVCTRRARHMFDCRAEQQCATAKLRMYKSIAIRQMNDVVCLGTGKMTHI